MHLSPQEQRVVSVLKAQGEMTTSELLPFLYPGGNVPPYGQNVAAGLCRSLAAKGLVKRSERRGPYPTVVKLAP